MGASPRPDVVVVRAAGEKSVSQRGDEALRRAQAERGHSWQRMPYDGLRLVVRVPTMQGMCAWEEGP